MYPQVKNRSARVCNQCAFEGIFAWEGIGIADVTTLVRSNWTNSISAATKRKARAKCSCLQDCELFGKMQKSSLDIAQINAAVNRSGSSFKRTHKERIFSASYAVQVACPIIRVRAEQTFFPPFEGITNWREEWSRLVMLKKIRKAKRACFY